MNSKHILLILSTFTLPTLASQPSIREQVRNYAKKESDLAKRFTEMALKSRNDRNKIHFSHEAAKHDATGIELTLLDFYMQIEEKDDLQSMIECYNNKITYHEDTKLLEIIKDILLDNTN